MSDAARPGVAGLSPLKRAGLAVLAGVLAGTGHEPFSLLPVSLIGLGAAFWLWRMAATGRGAFLSGWAAGLGYFALTLHWIVEPFLVDIARHGWMAPFAVSFMAGGMALFWGAAGWMAWRVAPRSALGWAASLAAAELARTFVFTGFPWALVGYVWVDTWARGWASVLGIHGLTLITALAVAGAVALGLKRGAILSAGILAALIAAGALLLPDLFPDYSSSNGKIVRLVQPNAPQHQKWDPAFRDTFVARQLEYSAQPRDDGGRPDLIVWPEASVPYRLSGAGPLLEQIIQSADGSTVVLGITRREDLRNFNALITLTPDGLGDTYDKAHLVPFGEYLPFGPIARRFGLRGLAAEDGYGYTPGPGPALVSLPGIGRALPLICYEAIFPHGLRGAERPDLLLQITNDAWFGEFSGPFQHLAQARMRAVEQGLPMVRVANTGVSAMIDAGGFVTVSIPLGEAGFIDAVLPDTLPPTLYSRTGDWPVGVAIIALLAFASLNSRRKTD